MDPRLIVSQLISGEITHYDSDKEHDILIVAEQAIGDGHDEIADILCRQLNDIELQIVNFRRAQMSNNASEAQECLSKALQMSRNNESRDHLLEARIRMEWGLIRASLGEFEQAGVDLKWSLDRLGALSEGHRWHGLSMLNMAEWHRSRGESGMALAIHAEISRHGPHMIEIISISRRRAAEIFIEKNHMYSAIRNLWIAHHGFRQTNMESEAIEAGLHWIDLGLSEVSADAPTMDDAISSAKPRSAGEPMHRVWIHPDDLKRMYEWLKDRVDDDEGMSVLSDASQFIHS
ncbi:MAG: hypothetical protein VX473_02100 [Candidatus Thermoplasmatota archaeon]|nr:hypothetical protein [Candidatus Thermoplasmatota archaeon]